MPDAVICNPWVRELPSSTVWSIRRVAGVRRITEDANLRITEDGLLIRIIEKCVDAVPGVDVLRTTEDGSERETEYGSPRILE